MKLLQINVWQGRLLRPLLRLIADVQPDVIFAQEIYSFSGLVSLDSPWNYFGTLELIAAQSRFKYAHFSPASIFPMFGHQLGYGNAILSTYEPSHFSTHYTGGDGPMHINSPASFDGNNGRNFQHLTISDGQREINLINHHAHWLNQPLGDETSIKKLQLVANYVNALSSPVVVAGDFNVLPTSPAMIKFEKSVGFTNLTTMSQTKSTLSAAHYMKNIVCDYVLTSPDIEIRNVQILDALVSDHRAILAEIN